MDFDGHGPFVFDSSGQAGLDVQKRKITEIFFFFFPPPPTFHPPSRLANVVFYDGHVESSTLQFLFADISDAALVRWNRDHLPHREKLTP